MVYRKFAPRTLIHFRLKTHILELLHQGAAYHGVKYQTYLQWLIEDACKAEARYYGWVFPEPAQNTPKTLNEKQQKEIKRLMRVAKFKVKTKLQEPNG